MSTTSSDPPIPIPAETAPAIDAPPEPCPTPLNWVDVVTSVVAESQPISVQLEHGEMRAEVYGAGPPLYFLGGATGSARLFSLTAYLLREQYTCLLIDAPVWSERPRAMLDQTANAICRLADSLGHSRFDLYAAGYGCHVALTLLNRHSDRIGYTLLQSPTLRQPAVWRERILYQIGRRLTRPMSTLPGWGKVQEQNHLCYFPPFDPTRYQFLLDNLGATPVGQVAERLIAAGQCDWSDVVPAIKSPVQIIRCEGEGNTLAQLSEDLAAKLPGCQSEWMHSAGHYPYLTHPNRLVKLIQQFLSPRG